MGSHWKLCVSGLMFVLMLAGCRPPIEQTEREIFGPTPAEQQAAAERVRNYWDVVWMGGCIGRPIRTCADSLKAGFVVDGLHPADRDEIEEQIRRNEAIDVTGKRVGPMHTLDIDGRLSGIAGGFGVYGQIFHAEYDQSDLVTSVSLQLADDPSKANTQPEYDKTGLFEAMKLILGSSCPSMSRLEIYKFFQAEVKPKLVDRKSVHWPHRKPILAKEANGIQICGRHFSFSVEVGNVRELRDSLGLARYIEIAIR